MNKFDYKNLTPFKWFVLENFPFIEADFDALTEWQLFCKLGKEINKIIDSQNLVGEQAETLTNAFNNLKNYVDNYFENLDVQDEINNKLNEMAESGELTEIIEQYLQLAGLLCFNTLNDLKNSSNLINGSFAKTYGLNEYNDGKGEFYKIREIKNTDIIDNINIIPLNNSNVLIAEKITSILEEEVNQIKEDIAPLIKNKKMILIGDSWSIPNYPYVENQENCWYNKIANYLNAELLNFAKSGAGYLVGDTFDNQLNNAIETITDKNEIDYVFVEGGYNDLNFYTNTDFTIIIDTIKNLFNKISNNFPNAKVYCLGINTPNRLLKGETAQPNYIYNTYFFYELLMSGVVNSNNPPTVINMLPFLLGINDGINETLHPNDIGMKILYKSIRDRMEGCYTRQTLIERNSVYPATPFDEASPNITNDVVIYNKDYIEINYVLTIDTPLNSDTVYAYYIDSLPLIYLLGNADNSDNAKYPINVYFMVYNDRNVLQLHLPQGASGKFNFKIRVPLN